MSLKQFLSTRSDMDATWLEVPFEPRAIGKVPVIGKNWTVRGSLRARQAIQQAHRDRPFDALFIHTQTISVLAGDYMAKIPTVLSLDATPLNYDEIAATYGDTPHPAAIEWAKLTVHRAVMRNAARFNVWSNWAKASLVRDYRVAAGAVDVVYPGTNLDAFPTPENKVVARSGPLRVLFVGGDFKRKGGDLLIEVCQALGPEKVQLHLVTSAEVTPRPGISVYRGVKPHSEELLDRYRNADVFAFPTRGDALALVLGEAMAASLPIICTRVGGLAEEVLEGETGYYMDVDDGAKLRDRLERLYSDRDLLARMGKRSRQFGEEQFDAKKNANRIGDTLLRLAHAKTPGRSN